MKHTMKTVESGYFRKNFPRSLDTNQFWVFWESLSAIVIDDFIDPFNFDSVHD